MNKKEVKQGQQKQSIIITMIEGVLYILGYTLVLISVAAIFKSFQLDNAYYGSYGLLAVVIIYVLNRTIKPILFALTLPITGLTLGLFYPVLNVFILKITDWILGRHLDIKNIWILFFISILISIMNVLMEELIIKPLIRGVKNYE